MNKPSNKNFKSGFVALVGRPNVGKSSLMNAFLGQKITITSDKPQTTRNQIKGILTSSDYQIIWMDTPGIHKPLHKLGEKMNEKAKSAIGNVEVVMWILESQKGLTAADKIIAEDLRRCKVPVFLVWNKVDLLEEERDFEEVAGFDQVFKVSATTGEGLEQLLQAVVKKLPRGPLYYPEDMLTDHPERFIVSELIREQMLLQTQDEIPHSVVVQIENMKERDNGMIFVEAVIYAERDSQKGIIIGAGGSRLKAIGRDARATIEEFLDAKVYLDIWVKVRKNWRNNINSLKEFGYNDEER